MLSHGDELGRTQRGNNNVYCQDNELSWIDWTAARDEEPLTRFTASLIRLRTEHPLFRRRRFFDGRPVGDSGATDVAWFRTDGAPMADEDWTADEARTLTVFLNGEGIPEPDALGDQIVDDSFLLLFNPLLDATTFTLPDERYGNSWQIVVDTADPLLAAPERTASVKAGDTVEAPGQTVIVLRRLY
jgi:glycogen operon protein